MVTHTAAQILQPLAILWSRYSFTFPELLIVKKVNRLVQPSISTIRLESTDKWRKVAAVFYDNIYMLNSTTELRPSTRVIASHSWPF